MKVVQVSESEFSVQGHGVHTAFVETTNALRRQPDIEVVVNSREPADIRHIHTVGMYAWRQLLFGKGKKIISGHIVPDSLVGSLRLAKGWKGMASWYLKYFYNRADAVIAVSDATRDELQRIGVKRPIHVMYNMVDTRRYQPHPSDKEAARRELGLDTNAFVVVSNGQVQPRKRVDMFVAMAKLLPDVTFVWVGGIPFKAAAANYEKMRRTMKRAPQNVIFTDVVPLEKVKTYLHAADVFVMPSDQETFGLAIVEAAAAGLPVVLRDLHDYDATFRRFAYIADDVQAFDEAIEKLRSDKLVYASYADKARELAATYDSDTIARELVSLYRRVLGVAS